METNFCRVCPGDPGIRKARGCDGPSQMAAGEFLQELPGDDIRERWRYRSCPQVFITATVRDWLKRRKFIKDFPHTQVPYHEVPERDRAFEDYYEWVRSVFKEMGEKGNAWLPGQRPT